MNQLVTTKKYWVELSKESAYIKFFTPTEIHWVIGEGIEYDSRVKDVEGNEKIANKVRFDKVYFNGQDDSLETALKKIHIKMAEGFPTYKETNLKEMWTEQYEESVS